MQNEIYRTKVDSTDVIGNHIAIEEAYVPTEISNGRLKKQNFDSLEEVSVGSSTSKEGAVVSFHDIWYRVKQKDSEKSYFSKKIPKNILKGVSGYFPPGVNAIMGPTGSGKTSLLDILAMRKDPSGLKRGKVLVNGNKRPGNFRLLNGYVVQDDDIVVGTLTVRENIAFSANLRLSNERYSKDDLKNKVDKVIKQLRLEDCADTLVGSELIRGVSGGERKRVNIGMELVLNPRILFLDEPTTGLDANTANAIILLLHNLAMEDNRTLIFSIHQPRYSIFELFNKLLILAKGEVVYTGPSSQALDYFKDIGYPCPRFHNPADFFLDIVGGDGKMRMLLQRLKSDRSLNDNHKLEVDITDQSQYQTVDLTADDDVVYQKLVDLFTKSERGINEQAKTEMFNNSDSISVSKDSLSPTDLNLYGGYATSFSHQLAVLSHRTVINIIRDPITSVAHMGMVIFFALLIGLVYFDVPNTLPEGVQNRHESASGYYRVSVYFISQTFADLIPYRVIPQLLLALICYWMIGLQNEAGKFFFFALSLILTCLAAAAICFIVSASTDHFALANIWVAIPYTIMLIFGGFLVNTSSLLNWLEWLKYLSIYRYGINALTVNEMTGLIFINNDSYPGYDPNSEEPCTSTITGYPIPECMTGEQYMDSQDIPYGTWGLWQNIVALGTIFIGLMAWGYIQLRRVPKYK